MHYFLESTLYFLLHFCVLVFVFFGSVDGDINTEIRINKSDSNSGLKAVY